MTRLEDFEDQETFEPLAIGGSHGQCISTTKRTGERCRAFAMSERGLCNNHDPANYERMQEARRQGGLATRKPGTSETLRAFVEEHAPDLITVLLDATKATKTFGFDGDEVPDHPTRIAAVRELLDRGIGKSFQASTIEHSGALSLEAILAESLSEVTE